MGAVAEVDIDMVNAIVVNNDEVLMAGSGVSATGSDVTKLDSET